MPQAGYGPRRRNMPIAAAVVHDGQATRVDKAAPSGATTALSDLRHSRDIIAAAVRTVSA